MFAFPLGGGWVRLITINGDGAADPSVGLITLQLK
jgi:hypothetical protein